MHYLSRHDLDERVYGIEHYRPGDPSTQDLHLAASSGTTTGLPTLLVAHRPIHERDSVYREWFKPLRAAVRISRNNHMALQNSYRALASGAADRIMTLDERDMDPENLARIMREYKPTTVNGPPSRILSWAQRLASAGDIPVHIHLAQIFGELLTPLHRRLLKETLPHATLQNGYMFSGANYPTVECPGGSGERHHILKGASVTRLSIADPDENGIGEIVATTNELKNYRTGDLGRLDPTPCPCGESPTIMLYGRKDFDVVPVLGALFLKTELERALGPYLEKLADYQLRVGETFSAGKLVGRAEFDFVLREGALASEMELAGHLAHAMFVTKTRTLADIIKDGIFTAFVVRSVAEIRRGSKKIPLKREDFLESGTI